MKQLLALLLICSFVFVTGCREQEKSAPRKTTQPPVKIGLLGPFSGADKAIGQSCMEGIQAALKKTKNLHSGQQIILVPKDDGNDKAKSAAAFMELVAEHVAAILVISSSECVLALHEVAEQNNIPVLAVLASHPEVTDGSQISQLPFDDFQQAQVASLYAMDELFFSNVAVIYTPNKVHYATLAESFAAKHRSIGGTVQMFPLNDDTELTKSAILQLQSDAVPFVYLATPPATFIKMVHELKNADISPIFMGSDSLLGTIKLQNKKELSRLEGVLATDYFSSDTELTPFGKQVAKQFEYDFDSPQTVMAGLGAEAFAVTAHAMNRCSDGNDSICVGTMIRDTVDLEGLSGKISIHEDGKSERAIFVNRLEDSQPKFVIKIH